MSGNPFRRAQGHRLPDDSTHGIGDEFKKTTQSRVPPKSKSKKKRVKIQTPPLSPGDAGIARRLSDGRVGSPPPPPRPLANIDGDDDTDSTATADSDLERASLNTRRNSGSLPPPHASLGTPPSSKAPYNPFERTLATNEAIFGLQTAQDRQGERAGANGEGRPILGGSSKPTLDVDAFKNLLLTGSASPSSTVKAQLQRPQDSSSSTDTSSASRHSLFDTLHGAYLESPRASFDHDHSFSDDDDEDRDNEHSSLMGPVESRPEALPPPAPPKHTPNRAFPQTVSFAEFDESIPSPTAPSVPRLPLINTHLTGILRPSVPRSPSDLNKPLPLPPADPVPVKVTSLPLADANQTPPVQDITKISSPGEDVQLKKAPPPPPTSRRQGLSNAPQARPRSSSNLSETPAEDQIKGPASAAASAPTKVAALPPPVPPPSRRTRLDAGVSSVPAEPALQLPPPVPDNKPIPPPPPRRIPSELQPSPTRPPLGVSYSNLSRGDSLSAGPSSGPNAPPAPPPRRNPGSSKRSSTDGPPNSLSTRRPSGTDLRRTSGQSFDSERSLSGLNLTQADVSMGPAAPVVADNSTVSSRDILADMSAFQAEIDALRARQQA